MAAEFHVMISPVWSALMMASMADSVTDRNFCSACLRSLMSRMMPV